MEKFDPRRFDPEQPECPVYPDYTFDPVDDPDVGCFFAPLPKTDYLPTWYGLRMDEEKASKEWPGKDQTERRNAEKSAAQKASKHASTPSVAYLDALGRVFLTVADNGLEKNGAEGLYETRVQLDIEGKTTFITDARGNRVMEYVYCVREPEEEDEDEEGNEGDDAQDNSHIIYQKSMDAWERWMLSDVAGNPIFSSWYRDGLEYMVKTEYDALRRPTHIFLKTRDLKTNEEKKLLVERMVYGESLSQPEDFNLREALYRHYDGAGVATNDEFDFKGNLLRGSRQLLEKYDDQVDWSSSPGLEKEIFTGSTVYDALNRPVEVISPDKSVICPTYNEANLLERVEARLRGGANGTVFVSNIDYDAKGQRELVEYGNGTKTEYIYDPLTYRLTNLKTVKTANGKGFQDLYYVYDPVGNIMGIRDDAQQEIYFKNQKVSPDAKYEYDALYRLISAEGREHIGQGNGGASAGKWKGKPHYDFNDSERTNQPLPHPNDGRVMRRYTRRYEYDGVGNILAMIHRANRNGNWTRRYQYKRGNNRLMSTSLPGDADGAGVPVYSEDYQFSARYEHDENGNMTGMPHLTLMKWDYEDQLQATPKQVAGKGGGSETTYYVYDAEGERVRKVTDGQKGTRKNERIYLGGFEIYREYQPDGSKIDLERETLHIMDDEKRIALVETRIPVKDEPVTETTHFIRYQLGNHLGSASLELGNDAEPISYEEYYPYGSTSYQAVKDIKGIPKRYRYTGKERDEETGLCYHGARYYVPWLARWTSTDPMLERYIVFSPYSYSLDNPIVLFDPDGGDVRISVNPSKRRITYSTTIHIYAPRAKRKLLRWAARKAVAFYKKPTIAVGEGKRGRAVYRRWSVHFDIKIIVHNSNRPALVISRERFMTRFRKIIRRDKFRPGDNVLVFRPPTKTSEVEGGIVKGLKRLGVTVENSYGILYDRPSSGRGMLARSLIHEIGHFIGFDDRYYSDLKRKIALTYKDYSCDFMSNQSCQLILMHPIHIREAAEFALAIGARLKKLVVRGVKVDDTVGGTKVMAKDYETLQLRNRQRQINSLRQRQQRELRHKPRYIIDVN